MLQILISAFVLFITSKDGQGIRILDDQLNLYQYSLTTHKLRLICSLKSEAEIVKEVKLSPDGKRLASVSKGAVKDLGFPKCKSN